MRSIIYVIYAQLFLFLNVTAGVDPCVGITAQKQREVVEALRASKIVPQVLPEIDPKVDVRVKYLENTNINYGNSLSKEETYTVPVISFTAESESLAYNTSYTILMVGPDSPQSTYIHYALYDAEPSCGFDDLRFVPKQAVAYSQPAHIADSKLNRYIFLVYRQPKPWTAPIYPVERESFDLVGFASKNYLELVCANFFVGGG